MYDALVIGGGPAGLAGAMYLARFRRHVALIDAGDSRAARIARSHNVAGFPQGVAGEHLISIMRGQAEDLGVTIVRSEVERLESADGVFSAFGTSGRTEARAVLLATGARDVDPAMPNIAQALREGALRYCPVCDGYEASNGEVGVLCNSPAGVSEALYLRHFTPHVQLFVVSADAVPTPREHQQLAAAGVVLRREPVTHIRLVDGRVQIAHGKQLTLCDSLYSALGLRIHSELAAGLGAQLDGEGYLLTDRHQHTCVPGLYGAGDVARGLNQISVAIGAAAVAASAMHLRLLHDSLVLPAA